MSNHRQIFRGAALADRRAARPAGQGSQSSQYARLNAGRVQARSDAPGQTEAAAKVKRACWHGRSDRRYVVTVHGLDAEVPTCGVALAVRREEGALKLVAVEPFISTSTTFASFRSYTRGKGATELHILSMDPAECRGRDAIVRDLLAAN
ncbi:hypothetical protein ACLBYG_22170 [Methylobacterium sp. D53M]